MKTMNFKKWTILGIALVFSSAVIAGNYVIDTSSSNVDWLGKKVTGEHSGSIDIKEGSLEVASGVIKGGTVIIDMQSIVNEDIEDADYKAKLEGHLKSEDFFSVERFPTAKLVLTDVKKSGDEYSFTGNLTIKGITKPVSFKGKSLADGDHVKVEGAIIIDRSDYDVKYGSSSFFDNLGDKMIYDDFTLNYVLVANK
ncbi:YceI family protein [uncultured Sunxiuqinia sp.]|uniref:YceI family protein n=1 Tax=uncultured Sunxiuqinia sp. TaxID=1573825 RepID=UPI002AA8AB29|nr:YceI family protein [uncultured Sunxiuqinia sp.]